MIRYNRLLLRQFFNLSTGPLNLQFRSTDGTRFSMIDTIPRGQITPYALTAEGMMTWSQCDGIFKEFMTAWAVQGVYFILWELCIEGRQW